MWEERNIERWAGAQVLIAENVGALQLHWEPRNIMLDFQLFRSERKMGSTERLRLPPAPRRPLLVTVISIHNVASRSLDSEALVCRAISKVATSGFFSVNSDSLRSGERSR